jgi:hypothetical protein
MIKILQFYYSVIYIAFAFESESESHKDVPAGIFKITYASTFALFSFLQDNPFNDFEIIQQ